MSITFHRQILSELSVSTVLHNYATGDNGRFESSSSSCSYTKTVSITLCLECGIHTAYTTNIAHNIVLEQVLVYYEPQEYSAFD